MSIRPIDSARYPHTFLLIATLAMMAFTALGTFAVPVDDPATTRDKILEHRFQEAASKNLLVKGLLAAENEKTLNQTLFPQHSRHPFFNIGCQVSFRVEPSQFPESGQGHDRITNPVGAADQDSLWCDWLLCH